MIILSADDSESRNDPNLAVRGQLVKRGLTQAGVKFVADLPRGEKLSLTDDNAPAAVRAVPCPLRLRRNGLAAVRTLGTIKHSPIIEGDCPIIRAPEAEGKGTNDGDRPLDP